jgi:hypothetical protein
VHPTLPFFRTAMDIVIGALAYAVVVCRGDRA